MKNMLSRAALPLAVAGLVACGVGSIEPPPEPIPLPFVVSDYYAPDGYWGDGEIRGYLDLQKVCPDRAPGAAGDCYTITYTPGPRRFAGINWQYPHNNWGFWRGHTVAPGATQIQVQARGAAGGEAVAFGAGQPDSPHLYKDTLRASPIGATLTTTWTSTTIPLPAEGYGGPAGVIAAFLVSLTAGTTDETLVFYLDDIRWGP